MAATVAFAVTAVLAIRKDKVTDLFGASVLGLITCIGGGTIRDIILDVPVFWSLILTISGLGYWLQFPQFHGCNLFSEKHIYSMMLYLDGFGAALFGIVAASKVWNLGFGLPVAPVLLGILTAIGGGLIRDVLAGRTTLLMRPEIYAVPILLGCTAFVLIMNYLPDYRLTGGLLCILGTFAIRAAAIHWNLKMPAFAMSGWDDKHSR